MASRSRQVLAEVALALVAYLARMMKEAGVKASFVGGGCEKYLVTDMLKEGLIGYILDGQTFDFGLIDVVVTEPESPSTPSARICSMPSGEGSCDSP